MNKVISIHIASTPFFIDEDAYTLLQDYLQKLERWFAGKEGGKEIVSDIESRLSELFSERIAHKNSVLSIAMVREVIQIMGQPEDFTNETSDSSKEEKTYNQQKIKKQWFRDIDNRALGGVCAGIAAYLNLDTVWVRIVFALLPFLSFGAIVPIYIVLWIAVPPARTTTQKMQMRGENITIGNIEKTIKEEFEKVKEQFSKTGKKYSKRDKNILTIVAVVVGLLLLTRMFGWNMSFVHPMNFHFPFVLPFAGGLFPLIMILLILGLIFRHALKGFLIAIVVLIIISIIIKLFSGMFFFTPWFMI